jgi:hypothetical protein
MKKLALLLILAIAFAAAVAQGSYATSLTSAADEPPQLRTLQGTVSVGDQPGADAIVYLKNSRTLAEKTFIAEKNGSYRFSSLSPNVDYEVYAELNGKRSDTKTLSSFDSRKVAYINLKISTK